MIPDENLLQSGILSEKLESKQHGLVSLELNLENVASGGRSQQVTTIVGYPLGTSERRSYNEPQPFCYYDQSDGLHFSETRGGGIQNDLTIVKSYLPCETTYFRITEGEGESLKERFMLGSREIIEATNEYICTKNQYAAIIRWRQHWQAWNVGEHSGRDMN